MALHTCYNCKVIVHYFSITRIVNSTIVVSMTPKLVTNKEREEKTTRLQENEEEEEQTRELETTRARRRVGNKLKHFG